MPLPSLSMPAQAVTNEIVSGWPEDLPIQTLFSGGLAIERSLAPLLREVWGSDTGILTSALGAAAAGKPFRIRMRDEYQKRWGWITEALEDDPHEAAATLMQVMEWRTALTGGANATTARRKARAARLEWDGLVSATTSKLWTNLPELKGFLTMPAMDALAENPDCGVVSYLPFHKKKVDGHQDRLGELFEWDRSAEKETEDRAELVRQITSRDFWMVACQLNLPSLDHHKLAVTQSSRRAKSVYIYGSAADVAQNSRVVRPRANFASIPYPSIAPDDEVGDDVAVVTLARPQYMQLIRQYGKGFDPGRPNEMFAVLVDGKLVGGFAYNAAVPSPLMKANSEAHDQIGNACYLSSWVSISPSSEPALPELILMAALSSEVMAVLENRYQRTIDAVVTTVSSNTKSSALHGRLFQLLDRREPVEGEDAGQFRYQLNYWQTIGNHTLTEATTTWNDSHRTQ